MQDNSNPKWTERLSQAFSKKAIIEEYLEGKEYSAEIISYKGKHKLLTITKKFTTGSPHFIETGHDEPAGINKKALPKIKEDLYKALDALHIKNGASHAEFKLDEDDILHIIEIGPRMGGDCIGSDLVHLSTGYDFMKMVIDIAENKEPDLTKDPSYKKASVRFIFTQKDLKKMEEIKSNDRYKIIRISLKDEPGAKVTNSTDRHGYYIYVKNQ